LPGILHIHIANHNPSPVPGEEKRGGAANTSAATGNDRYLVLKVEVIIVLSHVRVAPNQLLTLGKEPLLFAILIASLTRARNAKPTMQVKSGFKSDL
jgi:hypothetical protein